ncbi:tetratricopeptide repeat-containing sensor histidine kinase [Deminuibacter soli]|uniref:histidine kinase n=1 Tax=Deminuibacter soli TaxID=2291815 RepID=A0A3E1NIL7_9BACT|nr:histidine kinase dimerization/phosphoacceptor domain -containing protein [Deminuibacter soli]RFM27796.1 hypothetical protein DXN05_13950 [Deminuibacter soli]
MSEKLTALAFLFLLAIPCLAQREFADEAQLNKTITTQRQVKDGSEKITVLLKASHWYSAQYPDTAAVQKALLYGQQALLIAAKTADRKKLAEAYLQLSFVKQLQRDYITGKRYADSAVHLFEPLNNPDETGEAYVMLWSNSSLTGMPYPQRITLLEKAAALFHSAGNNKREAQCYEEIGDLLQLEGNPGAALAMLKKSLTLYQLTNTTAIHGLYSLLGNVYSMLGDYKEAVQYGLMAVKTMEDSGDTTNSTLCAVYNRLGLVYKELNDLNHAAFYFHRSLDIAIRRNDPDEIFELTYNITGLFINSAEYDKARRFVFTMTRKYPEIETKYKPSIAILMITICQRLQLFDKAIAYCAQLEQELKNGVADFRVIQSAYTTLINCYIQTGNLTKAADYTALYKIFCNKMQIAAYTEDYHMVKFRIDSATGNYFSAIGNFQRSQEVKDSLFNEAKSRQITQMGIVYETEKKDKDIQLLKKETEFQQNNLRQTNIIKNITMGGVILLLIVISLLYHAYQLKQKTNSALQAHQKEIDLKNKSLENLVKEKDWLVKEIHHRVKNNLHMVVGLLASQTEFIKGQEALDAINESQNRVQAMSLIHQKLYQKEDLTTIDMPSYILELTEYLKSAFHKKNPVHFTLDIAKLELPLSHSVPLGLILNEAITNAIKYAFRDDRPGEIKISLKQLSNTRYSLVIKDDGMGLPPAFNLQQNSSLGITLMQGLTEDIGGTLKIYSNNGVQVELLFNLPEPASRVS